MIIYYYSRNIKVDNYFKFLKSGNLEVMFSNLHFLFFFLTNSVIPCKLNIVLLEYEGWFPFLFFRRP